MPLNALQILQVVQVENGAAESQRTINLEEDSLLMYFAVVFYVVILHSERRRG